MRADPRVLLRDSAWRVSWRAVWTSRLVVVLCGVLATLSFGRAADTEGFDPAHLTAPFGYLGNLLAAPFARWDSVWYLAVASGGYDHEVARTAFFPLYPLLIHGVGAVISSELIAGVLVSLVAFAVALVLLYRLVALELDEQVARVSVLLVAFCPMAVFFSAVYGESLFLALSLACILQARAGRWAWAGVLGALAACTRATGVALLLATMLLFLYGPRADRPDAAPPERVGVTRSGPRRHLTAALAWLAPRHRPTPALGWLALIPAGLGAYLAWMGLQMGDAMAPLRAQKAWFRHFTGPLGGVWDGATAAWDGLRQLVHGPPPPVYFPKGGGDPLLLASQNLLLFGFLVLGLIAVIGALRCLPAPYGIYSLAALAMALSDPVTPEPLASLPRYELVLFPLFVWGARWVLRRELTTPAVAFLAVLLGLFTAEFATWRFVA